MDNDKMENEMNKDEIVNIINVNEYKKKDEKDIEIVEIKIVHEKENEYAAETKEEIEEVK